MKIDIGIPGDQRAQIVEGLSRLLADTYTLYLKTHNFHWNVKGPMFNSLHLMFMGQYTEMWTAVVLVEERIRALGAPAPGSYSEFRRLTSIGEADGVPTVTDMVCQLVEGHEAVIRTVRSIFPLVGNAGDEATADLLTQRLLVHEKTAWTLRRLLES